MLQLTSLFSISMCMTMALNWLVTLIIRLMLAHLIIMCPSSLNTYHLSLIIFDWIQASRWRWYHICWWWLFNEEYESFFTNGINGQQHRWKNCLGFKMTMLKNKYHLIASHCSILVSLWTPQPTIQRSITLHSRVIRREITMVAFTTSILSYLIRDKAANWEYFKYYSLDVYMV